MRKTLLVTTGLAWLALTGAAGAATVTLKQETALSPNYFVGQSVGSNTFTVGTDKWSLVSGTAGIRTGTTAGFAADPLGDTLPYMSVEANSTEQVVFGTSRTSLTLYWGSIDGNQGGDNNNNSLAITVDGSGIAEPRLNSNALLVEENVAVVKGPRPVIVTNWLPEGDDWFPVPVTGSAIVDIPTRSAPVNVKPSTVIANVLRLLFPPWFPSIEPQ